MISEHQTESAGNAVQGSISTENQESKADPTEKATSALATESNNETVGREPVEINTSPAEQQTEDTGNENAIIPRWNERTLPTQFMEFELNGIGSDLCYYSHESITARRYRVQFISCRK